MAHSDESGGSVSAGKEDEPHSVSTADVLDVQMGIATDEQIDRVRLALSNPKSEASRWAKQVDGWAARTFGVRRLTIPFYSRDRVIANTGALLERVFQFVNDHQRAGSLTSSDAASIVDAARSKGVVRGLQMAESSPRIQLAAITAMIEKIIELCPELVEQLKGLDDTRLR